MGIGDCGQNCFLRASERVFVECACFCVFVVEVSMLRCIRSKTMYIEILVFIQGYCSQAEKGRICLCKKSE